MTVEPFDFPKTIIKEGKLDYTALKELNVMEDWLVQTLRNLHQVEIRNILLATIDSQKKLQVLLFNEID